MDIVRKRRKRLLAWIVSIVLCVGVWHGNVLANDTGTKAVLDYSDNLDSNGIRKLSDENIKISEGEIREISLPSTGDAFTIEATTEGYPHTLINWEVSGSGILGEWNSGNGNNISTASGRTWADYSKDDSQGSYGSLWIEWGKILVVTVNADNVGYEEQAFYQTDLDSVECEVQLPGIDAGNISSDGKFLSGWELVDSNEGEIKDTTCTMRFGDTMFERKELMLRGIYDGTTVSGTGTFLLPSTEIYTLGNKGESWSIGDDYTYSGGISFVGPGTSLKYTKN